MMRLDCGTAGVFGIRLWPTIITLFMLIVLLSLGAWQVQRLQWKKNLITTIDQRIHEPAVDIDTALKDQNADYRPIKVSGLFEHDHELFLTAISLKGEGGYDVLTPLRLEDGRLMLVNRGWVPYDRKSPFTRLDGQISGPVTVSGLLRFPRHGWLQPSDDPLHGVWYGISLGPMAHQMGLGDFLPYVLDADGTQNPGGFPVGGQTHINLPNNHFVYALTWYGMALALLILYVVDARQKK